MMTRTLAASAVLALALAPAAAFAADPHGDFAVRGIGSQQCQAVTAALAKKDANTALALESWVGGYVTATNRLQGDTFDASPILANGLLAQMVVNVCGRAPTSLVETVTDDLLKAMQPARVRAASANVEAKVGDRTIVVRKETLIAMQTALAQQGLSKEPANGLFTPATSAGLKAFQAKRKLPQSGLPDAATTIGLLAPGK